MIFFEYFYQSYTINLMIDLQKSYHYYKNNLLNQEYYILKDYYPI
jgi:hypothetical protein